MTISRQFLNLKITAKRQVADDIVALDLVSSDGKELPEFEAGSHIDLQLAEGISRSYSLYGSSTERHVYRIAVLREPDSRGGSRYIHDALNVGDRVNATPPRNNFSLHEAPHHVLFAGGIGVTPMLSMAWTLWERGESFHLHYCARSLTRMALRDALTTGPFAKHVSLYLNDASPAEQLDIEAVLTNAPQGTHFYTCGPGGFIEWIETKASQCSIDPQYLHHEYFTAEVDTKGNGFEVFLAKSNITVKVHENESIADALFKVGLDVPISCAQGVCGTCITPVLEGTPDHRDQYLMTSEKESNKMMTLCCSRALSSRLVLDI